MSVFDLARGRLGGSVLADRRFRLLFGGQTVSAVGDQVFPIAVAVKVLDAGGTTSDLGVVLATRALALVLFLLAGGVLADRLPRVRVMVGADLLRLVAVGGLAVTPGRVPVAALAALTFVVGAGEAMFRPAYGAVLPSVLPVERLAAANALTSVAARTAYVVGPAVGGLAIGLAGTRAALLLDAATFGVSLATLVRIAEPAGAAPRTAGSPLRDAAEGIRAVRDRPWVAVVLLMACVQVMAAVAPFTVLLPIVARERLGGDDVYATTLVATALGGVVTALFAGRKVPRRPGLWGLLGLLPYGGLMAALATTRSPWLLYGCGFLAGAGLEPFIVWWVSALQREIPRELLARVIALDWMTSLALMPVGYALTGPAVDLLGQAALLWLAAGVMVVSSLVVLPVRGVMEFATPRTASDRVAQPRGAAHSEVG